ncbi:hypothetical protein ASPCAL07296 [Aspergillus calidoustus]|uniref:Uncharacterized protein n=1 Tax=Aspergillus calidoustus TaxID=454130 RepID=A0A0U5G5N2_ASPCI|nr:hypothetical protein ASPCAL07296 [Aspergillus calidoustus]
MLMNVLDIVEVRALILPVRRRPKRNWALYSTPPLVRSGFLTGIPAEVRAIGCPGSFAHTQLAARLHGLANRQSLVGRQHRSDPPVKA